MTSHWLARKLLEMPDVDVVVTTPQAGSYSDFLFITEIPKENVDLNCKCVDCDIRTETVIEFLMD